MLFVSSLATEYLLAGMGVTWKTRRHHGTLLSERIHSLESRSHDRFADWIKMAEPNGNGALAAGTSAAESRASNDEEAMPPLKNVRHEQFVQLLLQGKDATDAHEEVGFQRDSGNAARLRRNPKVAARLRELQDEIAAKVPISIESLIGELEEARQHATGKNQFAAAIKAILGKAQLAGLLVERSKVEVTNVDPFAGIENMHEIGLKMIDGWLEHQIAPWADYREEDRQYLAQLFLDSFEELTAEMDAYVAEIHARPRRTVNLKAIPSVLNGKATEIEQSDSP